MSVLLVSLSLVLVVAYKVTNPEPWGKFVSEERYPDSNVWQHPLLGQGYHYTPDYQTFCRAKKVMVWEAPPEGGYAKRVVYENQTFIVFSTYDPGLQFLMGVETPGGVVECTSDPIGRFWFVLTGDYVGKSLAYR